MVEIQLHTVYFYHNGIAYSRTQLPIQNAFALTIHKTQGLSLNITCLTLDATVFSVGQAYTAISRAKCWKDIAISSFDSLAIKADQEAIQEYKRLEALIAI